jgi:hypothetical protein
MSGDIKPLPLNAGTDQRDRVMPPLDDAVFAVDSLTLDQRVRLSAGLAQRLRFIDLHNRPTLTWSRVFESDESFVLAGLASIDRWPLQTEFLRIAESAPLRELSRHVLALAQKLDTALFALSGSSEPGAQRVVEVLEQRVRQQLGITRGTRRGFTLPCWSAGADSPVAPRSEPDERAALRALFFSLLSTLQRVQVLARERLPGTLNNGAHEPAPGLLLTFLRLYEVVQARINRFADRHAHFYYHEVLGLRPNAAVPDTTHIACRRGAPPGVVVQVAAGTRFAAGKDSGGEPVLFTATHALEVGDAQVAALATLKLQRDARIAPEAELGYVSSVRSTALGLPAADATPTPLFGGGGTSTEATLGLAVASPLLWMKEGTRRVELTLQLDWPGQTLAQRLAAVVSADNPGSFATALGLLFGQWMLSQGPGLSPAQRARLRYHARSLGRMPTRGRAHPLGPAAGTAVRCAARRLRPARAGLLSSRR